MLLARGKYTAFRRQMDVGYELAHLVLHRGDGLTRDRQGRLIVATFAGRSLMRIEKDGRRTVLADNYMGKRFGGPNDVVVKSNGAIYFTDTYGAFRQREKDPRRELDFNSVFMWKDGKLTLVEKDMSMTNGLQGEGADAGDLTKTGAAIFMPIARHRSRMVGADMPLALRPSRAVTERVKQTRDSARRSWPREACRRRAG